MLRSESPSGKCAKLDTVAASNNRDHPTRSLSSLPSGSTINCSPGSQALLEVTHQDHSIGITLRVRYCYVQSFTSLVSPEITRHDHSTIACSRHIYGCCSSRTSRSSWITHSTQHQRRGCHNGKMMVQILLNELNVCIVIGWEMRAQFEKKTRPYALWRNNDWMPEALTEGNFPWNWQKRIQPRIAHRRNVFCIHLPSFLSSKVPPSFSKTHHKCGERIQRVCFCVSCCVRALKVPSAWFVQESLFK